MRYACLIFHSEREIDAWPEPRIEAYIKRCAAWVEDLEKSGRHVFSAALQSSPTAAILRMRDGALVVHDGPIEETQEQLAGFTIIEARDLNEAIQMASKFDCIRVGRIEVRPLIDLEGEPAMPLDRKIVAAARACVFKAQK